MTTVAAEEAPPLSALRARVRAATLRPQIDAENEILADLNPQEAPLAAAEARAARWVQAARADKRSRPFIEQMLEQFPLD
ncbi:MAG TPA: hypothetical protein VH109_01395, partial [Steroidobacteraceae bacterium]|nr:hypothetical protein [Steroidobacteraceae bacterium]